MSLIQWRWRCSKKRHAHDDRVTLHECAVGAAAGIAGLRRSPKAVAGDIKYSECSSLYAFDHLEIGSVTEVPVIDIVQFLASLESRVSILKLDIEGAEADVLEALLDAGMTRSMDLVVVETHERLSAELKQKIDALRARILREGHDNIDLNWG